MFRDFSRTHNYDTRQDLVIQNVYSLSGNGNNCIRYHLPSFVNDTSPCILEKVLTHSDHGFTLYVKKQMISQYVTLCNNRQCYVCNHC